jgi:hypothetical protein
MSGQQILGPYEVQMRKAGPEEIPYALQKKRKMKKKKRREVY